MSWQSEAVSAAVSIESAVGGLAKGALSHLLDARANLESAIGLLEDEGDGDEGETND